MLLKSYSRDIFRAACNPSFTSVHCIARLDQDISAVLPYLNAEWGGFEYIADPPSVVFKIRGRLLALHGDRIAINALKDAQEVDRILAWLKREINIVWDQRDAITPRHATLPRPGVLDILKRLPRTNCKECGAPTCMVFATRVAEGVKAAADCPSIDPDQASELDGYMRRFDFDF
ncbi:MAG: (Fe-S)-binding protein [Desulfobacterales bacterium]|jgi:ArsR family metal-binding transcriptional regulator